MGSDDFDFPPLLPMPGANREMMEAMAAGSEMYEADTIEELAELIGVPADALVATVERYNELCELGRDEDFGKGANHLHPIDTPPYKAYKEAYYFFGVSSGVKANKNLQVVDANWDPIPHLYAAGNCVRLAHWLWLSKRSPRSVQCLCRRAWVLCRQERRGRSVETNIGRLLGVGMRVIFMAL